MEKDYTLVILAAGIGSRFGGVKQLEPVGPNEEILIDYSIRDAVEAGFRHIVFIIRKDIEQDFRAIVGDRAEKTYAEQGVRFSYAYQELTDLPEGFSCSAERKKPWGTVHAMLSCAPVVDAPFVVVNADDYYGKTPFASLLNWLKALPADAKHQYCLAGFRLENTLSDFGGVTRGICSADDQGRLQLVREVRNVIKTPEGAGVQTEKGVEPVAADSCVSMNMWGFTPDIFPLLQAGFVDFLQQKAADLTAELVISVLVDQYLKDQKITVQVLPTQEQWLGVTYREDLPHVRAEFARLHQQGIYA